MVLKLKLNHYLSLLLHGTCWHVQSPDLDMLDDEEDEEEKLAIQAECCELFATTDYIMEPTMFPVLRRSALMHIYIYNLDL